MQLPGYNSGNIRLEEGNEYLFEIYNHVKLQDGDFYFILIDANGLKHFMPSSPYAGYGLRTGSKVICRIDKINCTGRIFLEPAHPFYQTGKSYLFPIVSNPGMDDSASMVVSDVFGNMILPAIKNPDILSIGGENQVICKIISIRKGIPELEIQGFS